MSEDKNWNLIAGVEQAIKKEYGEDAIRSPTDGWTDEQEQLHLQELKNLAAKQRAVRTKTEKVEVSDGVFVSKKLFKKETNNRTCPICKVYSFNSKDDVYMRKFECCWSCYVDHVEGREERWKNGYRPQE